jgi:hypothetical protein
MKKALVIYASEIELGQLKNGVRAVKSCVNPCNSYRLTNL